MMGYTRLFNYTIPILYWIKEISKTILHAILILNQIIRVNLTDTLIIVN